MLNQNTHVQSYSTSSNATFGRKNFYESAISRLRNTQQNLMFLDHYNEIWKIRWSVLAIWLQFVIKPPAAREARKAWLIVFNENVRFSRSRSPSSSPFLNGTQRGRNGSSCNFHWSFLVCRSAYDFQSFFRPYLNIVGFPDLQNRPANRYRIDDQIDLLSIFKFFSTRWTPISVYRWLHCQGV